MITISRSLARQFRAVARLAGLVKHRHTGTPVVRLVSTADALILQSTNGSAAIERRTTGQFEAAEITVPMQLFADVEAKSDALVTVRVEADRLIASWDDRGVPQQRDYPADNAFANMPPVPSAWSTNEPRFLTALRDAKNTAAASSTRYVLDCLQLQGTIGTITATDSRQLLVQSGFHFPWQEEVLMRATNVFASSELGSGMPVEIGRTEKYVTVRVGEWTIHHEISTEGRFPQKINDIIPEPAAIMTRMQVDSEDAKFLVNTVNRLPADDLTDRPLTVDLNGAVVIRARKDEQSPMTEVLLSRSRRVGSELRLQTNRAFLTRALELGFAEVGFVDAESPCVCRDATRTYLWMLLENKGALESNANAQRIDSLSVSTTRAANQQPASGITKPAGIQDDTQCVVSTSVNRVAEHFSRRVVSTTTPKSEVAPSPQSTDVIERALALRTQLRMIVQGLTELVVQIRAQRKHTRLMKSTLQSLKQLQLLDA